MEENCEVCQQEEAKSPTLKISGTKILERVFIPSNECWICDLKFDDSESQVDHFTEHHECDFCDRYFARLQEKRKHVLVRHECPICRENFEDIYIRKEHIFDDHGLQACYHCEKYFQNQSEMIDHAFTVHLKCAYCWTRQRFGSLQQAREHVLVEHECPVCGKCFEDKHKKSKHILYDYGLHACRQLAKSSGLSKMILL